MVKNETRHCLDRNGFALLFNMLKEKGFITVGPTRRDGAILYDELESIEELPIGWTDEQEAGSYRLKRRHDKAIFGYNVGPHSWKKYLFPAKIKLWSAAKNGTGFEINNEPVKVPKYAFIGVRACELHAIRIQDKIFVGGDFQDPIYSDRRQACLVIAVNCTEAGKTCFCTSMQAGPEVDDGYDLVLTEIIEEGQSYFVIGAGSDAGADILKQLTTKPAEKNNLAAAEAGIENAIKQMGRAVDITDIKDILYRNYDNKRWEELEKRCLACGNCTMACPTCFCSDVEDTTDLTGEHAQRWRTWDSCFTMDFSKIHGGSIRASTGSRYRQWLTHKLATWIDQFGSSGCVGCGRCITWCPVGIDLTQEVKAIRESEKGT